MFYSISRRSNERYSTLGAAPAVARIYSLTFAVDRRHICDMVVLYLWTELNKDRESVCFKRSVTGLNVFVVGPIVSSGKSVGREEERRRRGGMGRRI